MWIGCSTAGLRLRLGLCGHIMKGVWCDFSVRVGRGTIIVDERVPLSRRICRREGYDLEF